jgi:hypothetical protein
VPVIRWLHKTWNVFWATIMGVALSILIFSGIILGLVQLDSVKTYIATRIETNFSERYNGVFTIGALDGTIPFTFQLRDVNLYADSSSVVSVFHSDSLSANLDILALLQQRFVVTGLNINAPSIIIDNQSNNSLLYAIKKKDHLTVDIDSTEISNPFFEILAPRATITNGSILIRNAFQDSVAFTNSDSLHLRDLDLAMFFEYRKDQRFLDIENLSFIADELAIERARIVGQVYSDDEFLEFNSFNINTSDSYLKFSGRIQGIDIYQPNLIDQFKDANYEIDMDEFILAEDRIRQFQPNITTLDEPLLMALDVEGTLKKLEVNNATVQYGNSGFNMEGELANLLNKETFNYSVVLTEAVLNQNDFQTLLPNASEVQLRTISNLTLDARVTGDLNKLDGEVSAKSDRGQFSALGSLGLKNSKDLNISFSVDSLDLGGLFVDEIYKTSITASGDIATSNYQVLESYEKFQFKAVNSTINSFRVDSLLIETEFEDRVITPNFTLFAQRGNLDGTGVIDFTNEERELKLVGAGSDLDFKYLTQSELMANTVADVEYDIDLRGRSIDDVTGRLSVNIPFAIAGEDTLEPHLIYADVANLGPDNRSLRITTTALDFSVEGDYRLSEMIPLAKHWGGYFAERIEEELFADEIDASSLNPQEFGNHNFNMTASLKDLDLLKSYYPDFPELISSLRINSNITVDPNRLLFNADLIDPAFRMQDYRADSIRTQVTGTFRYNESLKDFSNVLLQSEIALFETPYFINKGFQLNATLNRDSLHFSNSIQTIGEDARLSLEAVGSLNDSTISVQIPQFDLGTSTYAWRNEGIPSLEFTRDQKLIFKDFTFENQEELFSIDGAFSNTIEDSVNYYFQGIKLNRISDIVNGRIDFGGNLDGIFTTRTLTRIPTIEGNIDLQAFEIDGNIVGDLEISSRFNQELNRFDTEFQVLTDSTIYPSYFERNDRQGQNLKFDGYVLAPVQGQFPEADSLFYFDLDFNTVDLWVIPFLAPKVFTEMAGVASGNGAIWGNLDTYDFKVDYEIGQNDAVYIKPRFLDTYYYAQGPVTFSKTDGLTFKDIYLIDPSGGTATLEGYYNFNGFQPIHNMDISIRTDEFQFLNNDFDPTAPFFGTAYGTGVVRISGTNANPVLTTPEPMRISDFSQVELPLLEETEFNEDNKFIRFVNSFENIGRELEEGEGTNTDLDRDLGDLTFAERFTLDLQFVANNPMKVRLIFDEVTGDIITADGTGRIRIRLEDQDLSIFGRFDISGGNYQFVSGDIFTRRFVLEPGGSIVWEGEPNEARININAVYSARPNIRTLTTARADLDLNDPNSIQRTPVDLVLSISGSLSSIENNFYFRLPNNFESRQNSTLATQIAALNRNEDEKLLQATSFLLMGDFIPATSVNGASSLTENFSSSGAVLNPLLSNQVISPLLSNQINSLLRSDISSFDIDFNLNTYNQVDLGLALRLYNDRIILRRDGQITGAQSTIGDIGATYQINRTFSVTAFHRQDPTFSNISNGQDSQQAQDINGVGVEAEFSFNTWESFFNRLATPFRKLFGRKESKEEQNNQDDNPT